MCTVRAARAATAGSWVMTSKPGPGRAGALEQQIDDPGAGGAVEIAGRLVGEEQGRARRGGAGDRHALLLAARQLRRIMRQAVAQPDRLELGRGALRGHRSRPANSSGTATFSIAVIVGSSWNDCRMIPSDRPRSRANWSSSSPARSCPASATLPDIGALEPGDHRHQAALARPRRPEHGDAGAGVERQVDRFQDVGANLALAEGQADGGDADEGICHVACS